MKRGPYCRECRGDRKVHWSANCWILQCAVDQKGLKYCYECGEFPCTRLVEWSQTDKGYSKALDRLRQMKAGAQP